MHKFKNCLIIVYSIYKAAVTYKYNSKCQKEHILIFSRIKIIILGKYAIQYTVYIFYHCVYIYNRQIHNKTFSPVFNYIKHVRSWHVKITFIYIQGAATAN